LAALERGIQGFAVISAQLESIMRNLSDNIVPVPWSVFFFSLKTLSRWTDDLNDRLEFFSKWV